MRLECNHNQLTSLPSEIGNLRRLEHFEFSNNPIIHIPPNVQRLIGNIANIQNIYHDRQSVHNHEIQKSLLNSIINILNDPKPENCLGSILES